MNEYEVTYWVPGTRDRHKEVFEAEDNEDATAMAETYIPTPPSGRRWEVLEVARIT